LAVGAPIVLQGIGLVLFFAAQIAIARSLGADEYGVFSVASAWLMAAAVFARFGYDTVILRYGGVYSGRNAPGLVHAVIAFSSRQASRAALVVSALVVFASILAILVGTGARLGQVVLLGAPIVMIVALAGLRQSALLVAGRPVAALTPEYIVRPTVLLVAATGMLLVGQAGTATTMIVVGVASSGLALLLGQVWQRAYLHQLGGPERLGDQSVEWTRLSVSMLWLGGAYQLVAQQDVLVAGAVLSHADAAHYSAAKQVASVGLLGLIALQAVASPRLASAFERSDYKGLASEARTVARLGFAFAVAYLFLAMVAGSAGLYAYGTSFTEARIALLVLCVAQVANAFLGPAGTTATMVGLELHVAAVYSVAVIGGGAATLVLAERYGVEGISIGVLMVTIAWGSAVNLLLWKKRGIHTLAYCPLERQSQ
jgi:O-antigen/teichoic acid export membrane protein